MTLHISLVAVRGEAKEDLEDLLRDCGYESTGEARPVPSWDGLEAALLGPEDKALCVHAGWTVLIDPEFTIQLAEDKLLPLSARYGEVITMICEDISRTYGYAVFKNGEKIRGFSVSLEKIVEDMGEPLPEEGSAPAESLDETAVQAIIERLGLPYEEIKRNAPLNVLPLRCRNALHGEELARTVELVIDGPAPVMKRRHERGETSRIKRGKTWFRFWEKGKDA